MGQTGFAWGASIYLRGAKNVGRIIAKLKKKLFFLALLLQRTPCEVRTQL